MPRDATAYLSDIIDACDSISAILSSISLDKYIELREKRSAVEREFIIIGEAVLMLSKFSPDLFNLISDGRKSIGFRNILTHNYASIEDESVYETAKVDAPRLRRECVEILKAARNDSEVLTQMPRSVD